ncbi:hypothetical protein [Endozoicomonas euniceicola]|uniref:Transmembrane protein n=1 Tax=Endozoicomonas euniceicola TaxID=1234143 RepID=A0ABY6GSF2_9GAMM|nr:hypothetical protein [Endozoicomonas euniceicola]UYM15685.1 hypothetical protein NX720_23105 [Endozoicomonas euniceicola]
MFILLCQVTGRVEAADYLLILQRDGKTTSILLNLTEDEENNSGILNTFFGMFNYCLSRWRDDPQSTVPPEEYEMGGHTYASVPVAARGGGAQEPDQGQGHSEEPDESSLDFITEADSPIINQQPEAVSRHPVIRSVYTGNSHVTAWLEENISSEGVPEHSPVYQVPRNRLEEFAGLMASLMRGDGEETNSCGPIRRCGKYVFDSSLNPKWKWGRFIVPCIGGLALGGGIGAISQGFNGLGSCIITTGGIATPTSTWAFGYAPFSNEFLVDFSFSWDSLPVTWPQMAYLRQIASILRRTGEYRFITSSFDSLLRRQVLKFRVGMPETVDAGQLEGWLQSLNQQSGSRFTINVQPFSE